MAIRRMTRWRCNWGALLIAAGSWLGPMGLVGLVGWLFLLPRVAHSKVIGRRPEFIEKEIQDRFGKHRTVEIVNERGKGARVQTLVRCEGRLYMVTWEEKTKPAKESAQDENATTEPRLLAIHFPSSEPNRHPWSPRPIYLVREEKYSRPSQQAFSDDLIEADQKIARVFLARMLGLPTVKGMAIVAQMEQGGRRFSRIHVRAPLLGDKAPAFSGKFEPSPDPVVEWRQVRGGFDVLAIYGDRAKFGLLPQYKGEVAGAGLPESVEKILFGPERMARQKEMVALERKLWQQTQAELATPRKTAKPPKAAKPTKANKKRKRDKPKTEKQPQIVEPPKTIKPLTTAKARETHKKSDTQQATPPRQAENTVEIPELVQSRTPPALPPPSVPVLPTPPEPTTPPLLVSASAKPAKGMLFDTAQERSMLRRVQVETSDPWMKRLTEMLLSEDAEFVHAHAGTWAGGRPALLGWWATRYRLGGIDGITRELALLSKVGQAPGVKTHAWGTPEWLAESTALLMAWRGEAEREIVTITGVRPSFEGLQALERALDEKADIAKNAHAIEDVPPEILFRLYHLRRRQYGNAASVYGSVVYEHHHQRRSAEEIAAGKGLGVDEVLSILRTFSQMGLDGLIRAGQRAEGKGGVFATLDQAIMGLDDKTYAYLHWLASLDEPTLKVTPMQEGARRIVDAHRGWTLGRESEEPSSGHLAKSVPGDGNGDSANENEEAASDGRLSWRSRRVVNAFLAQGFHSLHAKIGNMSGFQYDGADDRRLAKLESDPKVNAHAKLLIRTLRLAARGWSARSIRRAGYSIDYVAPALEAWKSGKFAALIGHPLPERDHLSGGSGGPLERFAFGLTSHQTSEWRRMVKEESFPLRMLLEIALGYFVDGKGRDELGTQMNTNQNFITEVTSSFDREGLAGLRWYAEKWKDRLHMADWPKLEERAQKGNRLARMLIKYFDNLKNAPEERATIDEFLVPWKLSRTSFHRLLTRWEEQSFGAIDGGEQSVHLDEISPRESAFVTWLEKQPGYELSAGLIKGLYVERKLGRELIREGWAPHAVYSMRRWFDANRVKVDVGFPLEDIPKVLEKQTRIGVEASSPSFMRLKEKGNVAGFLELLHRTPGWEETATFAEKLLDGENATSAADSVGAKKYYAFKFRNWLLAQDSVDENVDLTKLINVTAVMDPSEELKITHERLSSLPAVEKAHLEWLESIAGELSPRLRQTVSALAAVRDTVPVWASKNAIAAQVGYTRGKLSYVMDKYMAEGADMFLDFSMHHGSLPRSGFRFSKERDDALREIELAPVGTGVSNEARRAASALRQLARGRVPEPKQTYPWPWVAEVVREFVKVGPAMFEGVDGVPPLPMKNRAGMAVSRAVGRSGQ